MCQGSGHSATKSSTIVISDTCDRDGLWDSFGSVKVFTPVEQGCFGDVISIYSVSSSECWPARVSPSADAVSSVILREDAWEDFHQRGIVPKSSSSFLEITIQPQIWPLDQFVELVSRCVSY